MTPKQIIEKIKASGVEFDQLLNEHNIWVHISYNKGKNRKQVLEVL
jgi:putative chitinase